MKLVSVTALMLVKHRPLTRADSKIVEIAKKELDISSEATVHLEDSEYSKELKPFTVDDDEDWW